MITAVSFVLNILLKMSFWWPWVLLTVFFLHTCRYSYHFSQVLHSHFFLICLVIYLFFSLLFPMIILNFATKLLSNAALVIFVGFQLLAIKYNFPGHPTFIHIFFCLSFSLQTGLFLIYFGFEKLALLK